MLTVGSLFSGIGGLELGLEWAGLGPVLWQVEIDAWCRGVLARHWPKARRFADVTKVGRSNLAPVDVICGGFPCQDVSVMGRGLGLDGARSGLWREYARIVDEVRPTFVVVENVRALVARGMDRVVADLVRCGYCVHGRIIAAADVGAPHRRERLFIVAHAHCERRNERAEDADGRVRERRDGTACGSAAVANARHDGRERSPASDSQDGRLDVARRHDAPRCREDVADADGDAVWVAEQRMPGRRARGVCDEGRAVTDDAREPGGRLAEPGMGGDAHGISDRVERWPARPGDAPDPLWEPARATRVTSPTRNARLHALGTAVVPQVAAAVGAFVRELGGVR